LPKGWSPFLGKKNKNMPNIYNNDNENLEEDLSEELEESPFAKAMGDKSAYVKALTDKDEDSEALSPIFSEAVADSLVSDDDIEETDLAEDEDDLDENESSYAKATEDEVDDDCVIISKNKIILVNKLLQNIRENTDRLSSILSGITDDGDEERVSIAEVSDGLVETEDGDGKIVEGVFDGENMIGPDGNSYSVPANYASKSKLVEGDMLKLTITDRGAYRYKQTRPIERKRIIGKLEKDANGNYLVKAEHKKFRVITASITYYKGVSGDKVVILVPVAGDSAWAAVENVIKSK
jgi:hypothetical protein